MFDPVSTISESFTDSKVNQMSLSNIMLYAVSMKRPGLSAMRTTSQIINDLDQNGFTVGKNKDGSENMVYKFVYILVKNIFDAIKHDSFVASSIPPGGLKTQGVGANAGGPVSVLSTTFSFNDIKGTII